MTISSRRNTKEQVTFSFRGMDHLICTTLSIYQISTEKLLQTGEERTFNFLESMFPLNIRIEAENGLAAAFQFWNLPKVVTRLDEVMEDILYYLTDYDRNPESTADFIGIGVITMLKAIRSKNNSDKP